MINIAIQTLQNLEIEDVKATAPACPHCGSANVYGMSRVVGYFSKINNWNGSKKAELAARQKGNYRI